MTTLKSALPLLLASTLSQATSSVQTHLLIISLVISLWTHLSSYSVSLFPFHLSFSVTLTQLFDEKIKDCKEDESRRVSTSEAALSSCLCSPDRVLPVISVKTNGRKRGRHRAGKRTMITVSAGQMIDF